MYKRIYDSEEIVVDYYNDGKPMIRVSQFKDYHWQDEHFVELPEEIEPVVHAHWFCNEDSQGWFNKIVYCSACKCGDSTVRSPRCRYCGAHMDENLEIRTCYCPICDKHFSVRSNDSGGSCPNCGHHVVLHREGEE